MQCRSGHRASSGVRPTSKPHDDFQCDPRVGTSHQRGYARRDNCHGQKKVPRPARAASPRRLERMTAFHSLHAPKGQPVPGVWILSSEIGRYPRLCCEVGSHSVACIERTRRQLAKGRSMATITRVSTGPVVASRRSPICSWIALNRSGLSLSSGRFTIPPQSLSSGANSRSKSYLPTSPLLVYDGPLKRRPL